MQDHLEFFGELGVDGRAPRARRGGRAAARTRPTDLPSRPVPECGPHPSRADDPASDVARRHPRRHRPDCSRCKLHTLGRQQVVFGVGNPNADLMFVGEAPGADEDIQGEPFVGRAGQLLTKIIEAIGLRREDVYIANVIKCRPPGNRNPEPDEVEQCEPFLFRQIDVDQAEGHRRARQVRGAVRCCKTDDPITRIRGREFELPRRRADSDLPPGVPAAEPVGEAGGVGGHEEGPRDPVAGRDT